MKTTPRFIRDAARRAVAERIAHALGLKDAPALRTLVASYGPQLGKIFDNPLWDYPSKRGTWSASERRSEPPKRWSP